MLRQPNSWPVEREKQEMAAMAAGSRSGIVAASAPWACMNTRPGARRRVPIIVRFVRQLDGTRVTTVMMYTLDDVAVERYQKLHDAFDFY
jgi:hypothetical protein